MTLVQAIKTLMDEGLTTVKLATLMTDAARVVEGYVVIGAPNEMQRVCRGRIPVTAVRTIRQWRGGERGPLLPIAPGSNTPMSASWIWGLTHLDDEPTDAQVINAGLFYLWIVATGGTATQGLREGIAILRGPTISSVSQHYCEFRASIPKATRPIVPPLARHAPEPEPVPAPRVRTPTPTPAPPKVDPATRDFLRRELAAWRAERAREEEQARPAAVAAVAAVAAAVEPPPLYDEVFEADTVLDDEVVEEQVAEGENENQEVEDEVESTAATGEYAEGEESDEENDEESDEESEVEEEEDEDLPDEKEDDEAPLRLPPLASSRPAPPTPAPKTLPTPTPKALPVPVATAPVRTTTSASSKRAYDPKQIPARFLQVRLKATAGKPAYGTRASDPPIARLMPSYLEYLVEIKCSYSTQMRYGHTVRRLLRSLPDPDIITPESLMASYYATGKLVSPHAAWASFVEHAGKLGVSLPLLAQLDDQD